MLLCFPIYMPYNRFIISFKFDFGGKLKQDRKDSQRNLTNTDGQRISDYQLFKIIIMDRGMDKYILNLLILTMDQEIIERLFFSDEMELLTNP